MTSVKDRLTEAEIIQAWKENEYMGFGGMPEECQEWAGEHHEENIWGIDGNSPIYRYVFVDTRVYHLNPEYQPALKPTDSDWVEFDIEEEAYGLKILCCGEHRHWQDHKLSAFRDYRTLPDGRVLTAFGGWKFFGDPDFVMDVAVGTTEIPKKIRFRAERRKR